MPPAVRQLLTAVRALLVLTVLLGIGYPLLMVGVGQLALPQQAHGSLVSDRSGQVVASSLIGQSFTADQWFQPRPSAGGYDPLASGGTNTGPSDGELAATIQQRRAAIARRDGVSPAQVPADAVTSSASGLDPQISPAYAVLQVDRVARARGLPAQQLRRLVDQHTLPRSWGFLGQSRVNVVELNLALQQLG